MESLLQYISSECKVGKKNPKHDYTMAVGLEVAATIDTCNDEKDLDVTFDNQKATGKVNKMLRIMNQKFYHCR